MVGKILKNKKKVFKKKLEGGCASGTFKKFFMSLVVYHTPVLPYIAIVSALHIVYKIRILATIFNINIQTVVLILKL